MNPKNNMWNTRIVVSKETVKLRVVQMLEKKEHYVNQKKIEFRAKTIKRDKGIFNVDKRYFSLRTCDNHGPLCT